MADNPKAKEFLNARAMAYRRVFDLKNSKDADAVMVNLAKFCRAHESTAHPDPHAAARLDGRREVWLRIQSHLQLSDEELWLLHNPANLRRGVR